jgi:hypothetical protein
MSALPSTAVSVVVKPIWLTTTISSAAAEMLKCPAALVLVDLDVPLIVTVAPVTGFFSSFTTVPETV